ncbi:Scr1 family TA system antitoxin-like transcriptional regulator [Longispora sp. NPDC051575]|uniref:Scr1 family TA system antitoxin-like transcriptional regulator n=1 Tax=Longispora sp. NPDC051575 TaxID=3154943 RepID=UPI00343D3546
MTIDLMGLDPEARMRRVLALLIAGRVALGLTQAQVAAMLRWSLSKVLRIEKGKVGLSYTDAQALADLYRLDEAVRVQILAVVGAHHPTVGLVHDYRDLLTTTDRAVISLEQSATRVRYWGLSAIPPLLQTRDYAAVYHHRPDPIAVERLLDLLALRQQAMFATGRRTRLEVLLEEAALCIATGAGRLTQLHHLLHAHGTAGLTVRYVPLTAGPHRGWLGGLTLYDVPGEPTTVHQLNALGGDLDTSPAEAQRAGALFDQLRDLSVPLRDFQPSGHTGRAPLQTIGAA